MEKNATGLLLKFLNQGSVLVQELDILVKRMDLLLHTKDRGLIPGPAYG